LTVSRKNNSVEFSIFREHTCTNTVIPYTSCHPVEEKYAAFRYLVNRLEAYQLNPAAKEEELIVIIIQNILHNNGFPLTLINTVLVKRKPPKISFTGSHSNKKWVTFTFFGKKSILLINCLDVLQYVQSSKLKTLSNLCSKLNPKMRTNLR
jgi:hypothetical protein